MLRLSCAPASPSQIDLCRCRRRLKLYGCRLPSDSGDLCHFSDCKDLQIDCHQQRNIRYYMSKGEYKAYQY